MLTYTISDFNSFLRKKREDGGKKEVTPERKKKTERVTGKKKDPFVERKT